MTNALTSMWVVENKVLSDVTDQILSPLTTFLGFPLYGSIVPTGSDASIVIDINKLITMSPKVTEDNYVDFIQSITFTDLLIAQVSTTIPTTNTQTGRYDYRLESIDPIASSGYDVQYGNIESPNDLNDPYLLDTATELVITTSLSGVNFQNAFASVNGVFHRTEVVNDNLFIIDGYLNTRQRKEQGIVLCDTTGLGGHSVIPITQDLISSSMSDIAQSITLKISDGIQLTTKTVLLVLDGILYILDDVYRVVNDTTIVIDANKIDFLTNFINNPCLRTSEDIFGVRNIPNPFDPNTIVTLTAPDRPTDINDDYLSLLIDQQTIPTADISGTDFILSRVVSQHSFLILINNTNIFKKKYNLHSLNDIYRYECISPNDTPRGLLRYNHGKILPYTIMTSQDGQSILYLSNIDKTLDSWKTIISPGMIPSVVFDSVSKRLKHAELIEIYSSQNGQ